MEKVFFFSCKEIQIFLFKGHSVLLLLNEGDSPLFFSLTAKNVLGAGPGKRKTDGVICLRCHQQTRPHLMLGVTVSQSRSYCRALPLHLTLKPDSAHGCYSSHA